jgi:hypothetical protein
MKKVLYILRSRTTRSIKTRFLHLFKELASNLCIFKNQLVFQMALTPEERLTAIDVFQNAINDVYKEHKLQCLRGQNHEYIVRNRQIVQWFFDVVSKGQQTYTKVNFHEVFDDLIFCSDEIMYFTAQLFLYKPFVNNPYKERYWFVNGWVYPNMQNLPAKRFSMASSIVLEKLYNYWDRIGDLINIYFPGLIKSKTKVYFSTVVDSIPEAFRNSENYSWLKTFRDNQYKEINNKRIDVVHYITNDTAFKHKHIEAVTNEQAILDLLAARDALPEYFEDQINLTLDGFVRTVQFIEEVTSTSLNNPQN